MSVRIIIILILFLLITSTDISINSYNYNKGSNPFNGNHIQEQGYLSIEKIGSLTNNLNKGIIKNCPNGSYPVFNEINYYCRVSENNKYLSNFNKKGILNDSLIIDSEGIVISRTANVDIRALVMGEDSRSNKGELNYTKNILGLQKITDIQGKNNQYVIMDIIKDPRFLLKLNESNDKIINNFSFQVDKIEQILSKAVYHKENLLEYYTLDNKQVYLNKGYLSSNTILDYIDADWERMILEEDKLIYSTLNTNYNPARFSRDILLNVAFEDLKSSNNTIAQNKGNKLSQ